MSAAQETGGRPRRNRASSALTRYQQMMVRKHVPFSQQQTAMEKLVSALGILLQHEKFVQLANDWGKSVSDLANDFFQSHRWNMIGIDLGNDDGHLVDKFIETTSKDYNEARDKQRQRVVRAVTRPQPPPEIEREKYESQGEEETDEEEDEEMDESEQGDEEDDYVPQEEPEEQEDEGSSRKRKRPRASSQALSRPRVDTNASSKPPRASRRAVPRQSTAVNASSNRRDATNTELCTRIIQYVKEGDAFEPHVWGSIGHFVTTKLTSTRKLPAAKKAINAVIMEYDKRPDFTSAEADTLTNSFWMKAEVTDESLLISNMKGLLRVISGTGEFGTGPTVTYDTLAHAERVFRDPGSNNKSQMWINMVKYAILNKKQMYGHWWEYHPADIAIKSAYVKLMKTQFENHSNCDGLFQYEKQGDDEFEKVGYFDNVRQVELVLGCGEENDGMRLTREAVMALVSSVVVKEKGDLNSKGPDVLHKSYWRIASEEEKNELPTWRDDNTCYVPLRATPVSGNGDSLPFDSLAEAADHFREIYKLSGERAQSMIKYAVINKKPMFEHSWARRQVDPKCVYILTTQDGDFEEQLQEAVDKHKATVMDESPDSYFKWIFIRVIMNIDPVTREILEDKVFRARVLKNPDKPPPGYTEHFDKATGSFTWMVRIMVDNEIHSMSAMRMSFLMEMCKDGIFDLSDKRQVSHLTHFRECWNFMTQVFESEDHNSKRSDSFLQLDEFMAAEGMVENIRPGPFCWVLGYGLWDAGDSRVGDRLPSMKRDGEKFTMEKIRDKGLNNDARPYWKRVEVANDDAEGPAGVPTEVAVEED